MRSGPAARWIAPSTPPPPARWLFAALTMASTLTVVMSTRWSVIRPAPTSRASRSGSIRTGQRQAHVVPAESIRRAEREVDARVAASIGNVVQVALGIRLVEVDRRRYEL